MKKELRKGIIAILVVLGLGFGFYSLNQYKKEKEEKFRIEKIRADNEAIKQAKIADSIHKEEEEKMNLMMNACPFCNKQMGDKHYYMDEIGTIFTDFTEIKGNYKEFCSIKCCEDYLAKDEAEYYKTHTDDDGSNAYSNPVLDRADEDSNPNRTTCPQCNGSGYETGGIVNGEREEIICRMCHGSGKGHY
jgi:ATP synthase E chain